MSKFISNTVQVHVAAYDSESNDYKHLVLHRSEHEQVYPSIWQVITGTIELNETALECALREIKEEISLTPQSIWAIPYVTNYYSQKTDSIHSSPVFGIIVPFNSNIILSSEHQNFLWLSYSDCLEKLLLPSHKEGTKVFKNCILDLDDKSLFQIKII
jgi:dATP pyrophosphohydrolase